MPTLKLLDSLLMTALLHTAQASVRAMIFDFGREVGVYSALRLELRTMMSRSGLNRSPFMNGHLNTEVGKTFMNGMTTLTYHSIHEWNAWL